MLRFLCRLLLAGLLLGTVIRLHAQDLGGEPFTATVEDLKAASAVVPVAKEFEAQVLFADAHYRFAADGTLAYRYRLVFRVDSAQAVSDWSEAQVTWDPWNQKPAQLHARVLEPDGHFVELEQKTVTDAPVKADDTEMYSSEHVRRAPLPGMQVGAIVEQMEEVDETVPYFAGGGVYRFGFRYGVPAARMRVEVEIPSSLPFADRNDVPGIVVSRTEKDGLRRVVYEATNRPASHGWDIDLPTNQPGLPVLEFATGASWGAVARQYAELSDPQTLTEEAKVILPGSLPAERMARISSIVERLHKEVRYTGVEFGAAKIVPQRPSQVIERHYGDCKDKANLLVAMLRAAGVPAHLALLSTGPGRDVIDALPGMNEFNHAIVYVPAAGAGAPALWIDATAAYFAVGSLPYEDEGRNALVVAPETTGLLKTPAPRPEDSVLVETRTFKLAELGPAHVEETSETHGAIDATYRGSYGGVNTPRLRDQMETYVKNAYLARTLTAVTHSDGADLGKPFELKLVADGARRGFTSLVDAVVAVFPTTPANNLPKWFSTEPAVIGPDTSAEARAELELQHASRPASFAVRPYIFEERVRVLVPAGYKVRALPPSKTTTFGPASLTESYKQDEPSVVLATLRFNTGNGELTQAQALEMQKGILELNKREYVGIFFDQVGAAAMKTGRIREALDADRRLIAAEPADALHHVRLARALLDGGIGDEAWVEARKATELDPKLAAAFNTYGWALQHDELGERFGKGFDRAGSIVAYKQAIELDPDDNDTKFDLAIVYEYDPRGIRYAEGADLGAAVKTYQALIDGNKDKGDQVVAQYRENMLYALLYAKRFAEMEKLVATLPHDASHSALLIASAAAQHGAAAGIEEAAKGNASDKRNANLRTAGTLLANLRKYGEAAEILSAGMEGGTDTPNLSRQADLYRNLKPASMAPLPATDPARPLQAVMSGMVSGTLSREVLRGATSSHAYGSAAELDRSVERAMLSVGFLRKVAEKSQMQETVMTDLIVGNTTYAAKGDDEAGWDVSMTAPGSEPDHNWVVKQDGVYRIVAGQKNSATDNVPLGNEILWALAHGGATGAKAMLDWKRDLTHKESGDDPFTGPLLPRFWTIGSAKPGADSPEAMRLAALSLLAGSMQAKSTLGEIAALREKASGQRQIDLDLLLAVNAEGAEVPEVALPAALRLLDQEPDSLRALQLAGGAYEQKDDASGWQALLTPRLQKKPTDHDLLSQQVEVYSLQHDFVRAQETEKKVQASGKATANDYNTYAWLGLFDGQTGEAAVKAAQESAQLSKNASFAELHTLACLYAAVGKTTEARQTLGEAMYAGNQSEPNSAVWYALGMIYEQYGAKQAAATAYKKVQAHELDDHTYVGPTSTYMLAQARLAALGSAIGPGDATH